jgi:glycine cleavage system H protein
MSDELVFMMGQFAARLPADRNYATNHMWALAVGDGTWRFGFSAYAVRLLQDVYFLDWDIDAPAQLNLGQEIGQIESSKAESSLYAPIGGKLTAINDVLLKDPSSINVDKYGAGWLFEVQGGGEPLLSAQGYQDHLVEAWKVAERTIKGQLNN